MTGRQHPAQDTSLPPLRWFGADDVVASMPPIEERLELAERTLTALAQPGSSELPSKIGLHPRPADSFAHAMPAHLRGDSIDGDLVGMKWVTGFGTNNALGIPAISAVVALNDPQTGVPVALLDGAPITAYRTAAVSGVAIRQFGLHPGQAGTAEAPTRVALIGAGVQGRAHLPVVGHVLPACELHLFDRHPERAEALAERGRATPGIASVVVHDGPREAVEIADVVITAASFGPPETRQSMTTDWLAPGAAVVAVDYATYAAADVALDAALFLVDHLEQFVANRDAGNFEGYPDPDATIGEALLRGMTRPAGRVLISHLGVGLADVVFADAIVRAAVAAGRGTTLAR